MSPGAVEALDATASTSIRIVLDQSHESIAVLTEGDTRSDVEDADDTANQSKGIGDSGSDMRYAMTVLIQS